MMRQALLFEVSPLDPLALGVACVLVVLIGLFAGFPACEPRCSCRPGRATRYAISVSQSILEIRALYAGWHRRS